MDPEEASWRRRRARARGGHPRVARAGGRGFVGSRCCLRLLGPLLSSPGLLVLVVCYCLLGAYLFRFLESAGEVEPTVAVEKHREECIKELWHITERLNVLYEKNWTALVNERLRLFEMSVVSMTDAETHDYGNQNDPSPKQQSFARALFYSIAIMTTIGFGTFSPKTPANKIVVMLFAVFGIPITMISLAYIGTLLARSLQNAYSIIVPDISTETLCPLTDKIEYKSHPATVPQSLEIRDFEDELRESSEVPYSKANLSTGPRHREKAKQLVKSNSIMLTTMNLALDDLSQNLTRSTGSERHSLVVECERCNGEQNSTNNVNKKLSMEMGDSSEASLEEDIKLEEMSRSKKYSYSGAPAECSIEKKNNDQETCQQIKEWHSEHHDTPSRVPLIDKDVNQSPHCLQHASAEPKYHCAASMRPPTPIPAKSSSRRGHCMKYDQDSSPLAGSDRHLCSTPSLAAIPMDTSPRQEHFPSWIVFGILGTYICLGAAMFASWEEWTFLDGAFFCFMLLSTVGFGDLAPGYSNKVWNTIQTSWISTPESQVTSLDERVAHPWRLTSCCLYLLFGIILVASSISLIQKKWAPYIHTLRTSLDPFGNEYLEEEELGEEIDDPQDELREPSFNQLFQYKTYE